MEKNQITKTPFEWVLEIKKERLEISKLLYNILCRCELSWIFFNLNLVFVPTFNDYENFVQVT